jgi:hypothetical protein
MSLYKSKNTKYQQSILFSSHQSIFPLISSVQCWQYFIKPLLAQEILMAVVLRVHLTILTLTYYEKLNRNIPLDLFDRVA